MFLFPFYWMLVTAVLPTSQVLAREPTLVPSLADISFRAFAVAFERKPLATAHQQPAGDAGRDIDQPRHLGAGRLQPLALSHAGAGIHRLTLLLTKMLPGSLNVIPFFIMASTFHLIDSLWALMLANAAIGVPFATWLLKGFFDGIPRDLEHAAMIDGCGHPTAFVYIIIPLARPLPPAPSISRSCRGPISCSPRR